MGTHGKVNRPRIMKAIEYGHLDHWISAKDVAWIVNNEYDIVEDPFTDKRTGKIYSRQRPRQYKFMTTMMAARILTEFSRKGILEIKRKGSEVSLYRKVDKMRGQEDMEAE